MKFLVGRRVWDRLTRRSSRVTIIDGPCKHGDSPVEAAVHMKKSVQSGAHREAARTADRISRRFNVTLLPDAPNRDDEWHVLFAEGFRQFVVWERFILPLAHRHPPLHASCTSLPETNDPFVRQSKAYKMNWDSASSLGRMFTGKPARIAAATWLT